MSAFAPRPSSYLIDHCKQFVWSVASMVGALLYVDARAEAAVDLSRQVAFSIPSQPLDSALIEFSRQADVQLAIAANTLERIQSPAIKGTLSAGAALSQLLSQSALAYSTVGSTVTVTPVAAATAQATEHPVRLAEAPPAGDAPAQRSVGQASVATADPSANSRRGRGDLDEVVVSAEKRNERLQDVPVPVTAIHADALVESNQLRLQDYYTRMPGLNLTTADPNSIGVPILSIRGVTSAPATNPTVGTVIDDVPFGSSTSLGQGYQAPDINPLDLERVEVLRGPQGTLYGADSIGGLVKFVTVDPSTQAVSGRVQASASSVRNGSELGYDMSGAINVPLSETTAVRISGFTRQDPGYIDNPVQHIDGINKNYVDGGRLSALWRPSEAFTLKLSALLQISKRDGTPNVVQGAGFGDLQQDFLRGTGRLNTRVQAYSANMSGKLGIVDVTSVTGYNRFSEHGSIDYSPIYGDFTRDGLPVVGFNGFGVTGTPDLISPEASTFSQELRLSAPIGQKFEWLLGLYYTHQVANNLANILAVDADTLAQAGTWWTARTWSSFAEYAAFADLTFHLTDQFDVQIGGRESHIRQTQSELYEGVYNTVFLGLSDPFSTAESRTNANSFTYLITPRFKLSPDFMLYSRLASGYRPGGINLGVGPDTPQTFAPDKTQSYELGLKGDTLSRTLSFDASIYYINWKHIQQLLLNPFFQGYYANAGGAKSEGVELSLESRPATGLTLAGWVAWNEAVLTQSFPASSTAYGMDGDRLPYSARWSGRVSANYEFPLWGRATGFAEAAVSYVGERIGSFAYGSPVRAVYPAYTQTDLRAGMNLDDWTANLFVTNVTDRRGMIGGGIGTLYPTAFQYILPRTVGLSLSKKF